MTDAQTAEITGLQGHGANERGDSLIAQRVGLAGLILCMVAFWALQHPYSGLINDAVLYALAALARIHPESLGHDIFLSQGSQDHFTLFSPILAPLIRLLGVAPAAAVVTFVGQVALFGSCLLLARRLMSPALSVLAVALLICLPANYGAEHRFIFSEAAMTPRVICEALVIAALSGALARRYLLCALAMLGAMLLHPLMAVAGLVFLFLMFAGERRPALAVTLLAIAFGGFCLVSWVVPVGPLAHLDGQWYAMLHGRLKYAFPSLWPVADWGHATVPLGTLVVGALAADQPLIRSLSRATALTGVLGLIFSLLGSDLLHIVLSAQVQTWRWLWLSTVVAILLIPVIATSCWKSGPAGRATCLLLAAAWTCADEKFAPVVSLAAIGVCAAGPVLSERHRRMILSGTIPVALLCLLVFAASWATEIRKAPFGPATALAYNWSVFLGTSRIGTLHGAEIVPAALVSLLWWGASRGRPVSGALVLCCGIALCMAFVPAGWSRWTSLFPTPQLSAQFTSWRREIPPTAQVLAPGVPNIPWFLLERPSYWSLRQMAGVLFSKSTALELLRRETAISKNAATNDARHDLTMMCEADSAIGYIVTPSDMGPTPFSTVEVEKGKPDTRLHLYRCADHRG